MPQNKNISTAWQEMLGEDWIAVKDKYLHTLGNLTLTAYNTELGDKPFAEKKVMLDGVTKVVTLYADVKDCELWNEETIENRANNLCNMILKLYPMAKAEHEISFADPRYSEYTCDDPDNATYKAPNYFVLQGERVTVNNFADMLRLVIKRLYNEKPETIKEMARNNERVVSWSQNVMFSYEAEKVSGDDKLGDTDIYVSSGFSAAHIMCIIQALLDRCEIERSEFIYSARNNQH